MSRRASLFVSMRGPTLACVLALVAAVPVHAQTIADYSRAQRLLLETTMAQAAARSAGLGASVPAAGTPASPSSSAAPAPLPARASLPPVLQMLPAAPALQVSGVFASSQGVLAEVVVNATPYLLGAGQGVPGTQWQVESVAIDRVVLARHGGVAAVAEPQGARKIFPLPALR